MSKSGALIEKKVKAFAKGMATRMTTLRAAKVKEIDKRLEAEAKKAAKGKKPDPKAKVDPKAKKPTGEDMVMKLTFIMSTAAATVGRTGKQQAIEVAEGDSWVCSGSHMNDSARHINMYTHGPGKTGKKYMIDPKKAFGAKDANICTLATYQAEWVAVMKKQGVRNHGAGKGYGHGDDYHLELPNSRIPKTDAECIACVDEYCRLVTLGGYKNNAKFEKNWAAEVKAPMAKYVKEKQKLEMAERIAELKKMRFSGKITGNGTFFSKANDTKKATVVGKGTIVPPVDIVKEAGNRIPIVLPLVGAAKKNTYTDVYFSGVLHLVLVTFENLSQTFVKEAKLDCSVLMKGLLSYGATATAKGKFDITLGSGLEPLGSAIIDYSVDGIGSDDHKGQIVWDIKGLKSKMTKST